MAFKIAQTPKFLAKDITIEIANERGGWDKNTMSATFFRADTEEAKELAKLDPKELIARKLAGWSGVETEDKQPVEFNEENLAAVLMIPAAVVALAQAFWNHQFKAKTGN